MGRDVGEREKGRQTEPDHPKRIWIFAAGSEQNRHVWDGDGVQSEQGLKTKAHEGVVAQQRDMTPTK